MNVPCTVILRAWVLIARIVEHTASVTDVNLPFGFDLRFAAIVVISAWAHATASKVHT